MQSWVTHAWLLSIRATCKIRRAYANSSGHLPGTCVTAPLPSLGSTQPTPVYQKSAANNRGALGSSYSSQRHRTPMSLVVGQQSPQIPNSQFLWLVLEGTECQDLPSAAPHSQAGLIQWDIACPRNAPPEPRWGFRPCQAVWRPSISASAALLGAN